MKSILKTRTYPTYIFAKIKCGFIYFILTNLFQILKKYQECLKDAKIPYFWNKNYNLLEVVEGDLSNTSNRLLNIIKDIDKNVSQNPAVILKYLCKY